VKLFLKEIRQGPGDPGDPQLPAAGTPQRPDLTLAY
jgi:hypothetical protein